MVQQICVVCNKEFTAKQSNYITCSTACRVIRNKSVKAVYRATHRDMLNQRVKAYQRQIQAKIAANRKCFMCNTAIVKNTRRTYPCDDCLIKLYIKADDDLKRKYRQVLHCRGYDNELLKYAIEQINPTE